MKAREVELKEIYNRLVQWIYLGCLMSVLPLVVMLSVFLTYTKILGLELTAPVAFTALALFNKLHHAFDEIPSTFIAFIQARVSIVRIEKFLAEPEVSSNNIVNNLDQQSSSLDGNILIGFKDATFQWPDGTDSEDTALDKPSLSLDPPPIQSPLNKFFLRDLNITFPVNELSIICGQTGCGKTSLLMALLGEMECINGRVFLPKKIIDQSSGTMVGGAPSGIAYVAQTGNLMNESFDEMK
jgi:ABC-type multidrug transport system fused ATPase/permease subunit